MNLKRPSRCQVLGILDHAVSDDASTEGKVRTKRFGLHIWTTFHSARGNFEVYFFLDMAWR